MKELGVTSIISSTGKDVISIDDYNFMKLLHLAENSNATLDYLVLKSRLPKGVGIFKIKIQEVLFFVEYFNTIEDISLIIRTGTCNLRIIEFDKNDRVEIVEIDDLTQQQTFLINAILNSLGSLLSVIDISSVVAYGYGKNIKIKPIQTGISIFSKKLGIEFSYSRKMVKDSIEIDNNEVTILTDSVERRRYIIPSKLYPLPNYNMSPKVFTHENTEDFEDDYVNDKLTGTTFNFGMCYSNSQKVVEALGEGYDFYTGWLIYFDGAIHHAWVVKDNKVVDVGILRNLPLYEKSKDIAIKAMVDAKNAEISFKEKYMYGKVKKGTIYIGVKSTEGEARNSYNDLIAKNPNHPDYLNVNKETSMNKTMEKIQQYDINWDKKKK